MNPVSPVPAIVSLLVAIATTALIVKKWGAPPEQGRFASIDGLRGYLAFFVFLHHSCVWYFFLRTGHWSVPPSRLYSHFGHSSVAFFFMITGFLFFSKLLDGKTRKIDWGKLFISRFLRLAPLYVFAMFLLFLIVAVLSNGILNEPVHKLLRGMVRWLCFTITSEPDLNGIKDTTNIMAGVTWSLPYEWFFYFSLPLLALVVGVRPPIPYLLLGMASIVGLTMFHPKLNNLFAFLGGFVAAILVRSNSFRHVAVHRFSSLAALGCIGTAIFVFPLEKEALPLFLLSVAFVLIASGNSLFGILTRPVSRTLGEISYSLYLLHGIVLFVFYHFVIGLPKSKALSPVMHWIQIVGLTPVLLCICFTTFWFIERPAMRSTTAFSAWLRLHLSLRSKGLPTTGAPPS